MKMIFAMLHSEDVDETVEELNKEKYWVTKLSTTGGFLKNKNVTRSEERRVGKECRSRWSPYH